MSTDTSCDGGGKYEPYPHCGCWPRRACCRCSTPSPRRDGGMVALCEFHATTPVSKWDAPATPPADLAHGPCDRGPCIMLAGHEGRCSLGE